MFISSDLIHAEKSFLNEGDFVTFKNAVLTKYNGAVEIYDRDHSDKNKENEVVALSDYFIKVITQNIDKLNPEQRQEVKEGIELMKRRKKIIRF